MSTTTNYTWCITNADSREDGYSENWATHSVWLILPEREWSQVSAYKSLKAIVSAERETLIACGAMRVASDGTVTVPAPCPPLPLDTDPRSAADDLDEKGWLSKPINAIAPDAARYKRQRKVSYSFKRYHSYMYIMCSLPWVLRSKLGFATQRDYASHIGISKQ